MPELPEVEALVAFLDARTRGRRVDAIRLRSFAALKTVAPPITALERRDVRGWSRRGKFLLLDTGELWLGLHLARAGWIRWRDRVAVTTSRPTRGPIALTISLDDGSGLDITEQGTEKRLAVYVVRDPTDIEGIARLGPDPLDPSFDVTAFATRLHKQSGQLKSVLTDQSVIAGIGNAYSDEILHAARMSPFRRASALTARDAETLHTEMLTVLRSAVARSADLPAADLKSEKRSGMAVHGRAGESCPTCGDTIREVSLASRSFQYCPKCQTGGRHLSDRRLSRLLK